MDALYILIIPILLALFIAANMGASGTATAFAAAYGAKVIKKKAIPLLFGVMVIAGALLAGKEVTTTLGEGILSPSYFTPIYSSIILLAIGISLFAANLMGVPQSTSQTTVMAIAGAAIALDGLNSEKLIYEIIPYWFVLPVIAFFLMLFINWILPRVKKELPNYDFTEINEHKGLKIFLIISSLYVAFSVGANNVANAAGPIASLTMNELNASTIGNNIPIALLSILIVAPFFGFGSAIFGHKVTRSTGKEIVKVTPLNASIISLLVATLLLYASIFKGIPTSLVQLNGAAFIALSIGKHGRNKTFKNRTVRKFLSVWMVAPIFAFGLTYLLVLIFK